MKYKFNNVSQGKDDKPRLLFTAGGGVGASSYMELLSSKYELYFADADIEAKHYSIADYQWHQIPYANEPNFSEEIVNLCQKLQINLLVPAVDEELLLISKIQNNHNFDVLLPPEHFLLRHLDKYTSNIFINDAGLPAPKTVTANNIWNDFPCIVKPRNGRGSRYVATVHSKAELQAQITLAQANQEDFIIQELIIGEEYTVMVAADNKGKLKAVVPVKVKSKRGITIDGETINDFEVIKACCKIHEADPIAGCYNIQLIKERDGTIKPFEINPRISTTACLCFAAGIDFIAIYLGLLDFDIQSKIKLLDFKEHLRLRRSWHTQIDKSIAPTASKSETQK